MPRTAYYSFAFRLTESTTQWYLKGVSYYSDEFRAEVVAAVRELMLVSPVARVFGVSRLTVDRWAKKAKVKLPPPNERMATGALLGAGRWPGWEKRRAKARRLRAKGKSLQAIATACGLSLSGAHYAVGPQP